MKTINPINLSDKAIESLRKIASVKKYSTNAPLYYQGQTPIVAYFILKGNILLMKKNKVCHKLNEGCLLGYKELFLNTVSKFTALALPNTEICYLDKSSLEGINKYNHTKVRTLRRYKLKINLQTNDPIKRQTEVSANDRGTEFSPMSPPEAYNPPSSIKVDYEKCHEAIKHLIDEHQVLKKILTSFESMLKLVKSNSAASYQLKDEINKTLENFKQDFGDHNKKEEKHLFPILASRFLEIGEHSKTKRPITPINVLEDEHTEATQLIHEIQYIWAVVFKIKDPPTLNLFLKDFLIKSCFFFSTKELI
jgi:hypothetical protein